MSSLSIERAREILEDYVWPNPNDYVAYEDLANPVGDYSIYARTRDSDIMEDMNYNIVLFNLTQLAVKHDQRDKVYDFRAAHWACGWLENIIVRRDAHDEILIECAELLSELADYPCLDDEKYSDLQFDAILDYWEDLSLKERIEYCNDNNHSIFSARPGQPIPDAVFDDLREQDTFN
jgi:hypothetical protein